MIRLSDASILALTKLRTRRIRTVITVVVSGILFSCLVAALLVAQGALHSVGEFNRIGLGDRYIVQASQPPTDPPQNASTIKLATKIYNQTITAKKKAAAKLDVPYDPSTEIKPTIVPEPQVSSQVFLNPTAPAAQQATLEYLKAHPSAGLPALKVATAPYHPTKFYETTMATPGGTLVTMLNGVENFSVNPLSGNQIQNDVLQNNTLEFTPATLTDPFLLPHAAQTTSANADAIPIVVPFATAGQLLGLQPLPGSATATQKLARIKEVYAKADSVLFAGCYRNGASEDQIQQTITAAATIAANKDKAGYQKPNLIYGLPPANSCGAARIVSDTQTAAEKTQAANQVKFDAMFGQIDTPDQQKIEFRIAGIVPDQQTGAPSNSAAGILQNLVGSSLSGDISIPENLYDKLPDVSRYNTILTSGAIIIASANSPPTYYAEFDSAADARNFINDDSCNPGTGGVCPSNKPFQLSAFGSNSIALQDLQQKFSKVFKIGALIVVVLAVIILSSTVGRMLADGRRETAVFRAVGAKRIDISSIYSVYTFLLSGLVAVFALALGIAIAYVFNSHYWKLTTAQAQLAFGGSNQALQFHLFGWSGKIWWVGLAALAAGMISMLLPLIRNVRRNPIQDMRDE